MERKSRIHDIVSKLKFRQYREYLKTKKERSFKMNEFKEKLEKFLGKNQKSNLAKINPERLMELWENTSSGSKSRKMIKGRMAEVYSEISDPDRLMKLWKNTSSGSKPEEMIEGRMAEVYSEILPEISDPKRLMEFWENTSSGSKPREMVEGRIIELVSSIKPEEIPDWFSKIISKEKSFPDSFRGTIKKKAEEIYDKLYS